MGDRSMTALISKLRSDSSPAGEVELASPAAERRRVRIRRLSAGLTLVVVASVLGWLAFQARGDTVEVWTAAAEMGPGAVITPTDLFRETVDVESQLGAVATDVELVGRTVRFGVPAGAAIAPAHLFAPGDTFAAANTARVGLVFKAGQAPTGLRTDDLLRLILSNPNTSEVIEVLDQVPVLEVGDTSGAGALITVELPIDQADAFVLAAARGDVLASVVGRR